MEVSIVDLPAPWRELWASADSPRSRLHATGGTFTVRAPNSTLAVEAVAHLRTEYRRFAGLFVANLAAARALASRSFSLDTVVSDFSINWSSLGLLYFPQFHVP